MPQKLESSAMRSVDWYNYFGPDLVTVSSPTIKQLERIIPYPVFLNAIQELEKKEKRRREEAGFSSGRCGNSGGIVENGSFGHLLEHAIVAVFNAHVAPSESCAGGITSNSHTQDPDLGTLSDIRIAFPPSVTKQQAEVHLNTVIEAIQEQYASTQSINLSEIKF